MLIKNNQNNLLFSYYKLRCRLFELNLFLHCFNLKDLNLNKYIERLRKELLIALQLTDLTKCPKCMLFTLQDQIICNNELSPA